LPGFGCLSDIFPQTTTHVCVPGVAGWVCNNTLACSAGTCEPWSEVGDPYSGFKTCSPDCASDADCLFFDQGPDNPNMLSHFSCIAGHCRQLQSVFFMGVCVRDGDECQLDPDAKCKNPTASPPPVSCDFMQSMMGTALAAGPACTRDCTSDDECATLSQNSHVTWACNKMVGTCQPSLPYIFQCTDDKSCAPTLNCLPPPGAPDTYKVCTHACNSSDDCAKNPGLGGNFACALGVCAPKTSSGCMPPAQFADLCLSGQLGSNGLCLSPPGWVCDTPERCLSGNCSNGHCQ
jgi:hypothetical protein